MKKKIRTKRINKFLIISLLVISSFAYFHVCQATWQKEAVDFLFGWVFELLTSMAGAISTMVINGIIGIASYNGFINQPQIIDAWKIVRDFCNMLFILILLVIAFASILRLENYSMKRWLPKVVIMAVLINFSRTIVGVLIDASQIVMLTFVNAFVGTGSNFVGVLQIKKFLTSMSGSDHLTTPELVKGYAFATIFLIVSVIVLLAILVVLVMRVIFLWIYVALSPLAFLMMAFPGGQKYASQYWGDFTKYLINGPVLAFFIWLALSTMQEGVTIEGLNTNIQSGSTAIMNADSFMSFILAIAFMAGGLMMSSQIGGMGASWGSGMVGRIKNDSVNWGKKKVTGVATWGKDRTVAGLKTAGRVSVAGFSAADRLLGKKVMGASSDWGNKGLVNRAAQGVLGAPANAIGKIRSTLRKGDVNAKASRAARYNEDADGIVEDDGKFYKADASGVYKEWDKSTNTHKSGGESLRDDNNEEVRRMSDVRVSMHAAWNAVNSGAQGAKNRAQEELVSKIQKDFTDSNMTTEEMRRMFNDGATSRDKRLALAMTLAIQKGFKTKKEIDKASDMLGENSIMLSKFKDEVDKNQAYLAYDLTDPNGVDAAQFKKRVDQGKIDTTKMSSDAYRDKNMLKVLDDYHGKDFERVMETVYKRGKKYETSVSKGLLDGRDSGNVLSNNLLNDKSAKVHARLTGKVEDSFMGASSYDYNALGQYVLNAKPVDLNKASAKDMKTFFRDPKVKSSIIDNMSYGKLKSMHKTGKNPELVKLVKDAMIAANKDVGEINGDAELRSI